MSLLHVGITRRIRHLADTVRDDLDAVIARDPAARSRIEVALLYPGIHAVWAHRASHALWQRDAVFTARALSQLTRFITNIEIHPGAQIGPRLVIDHGAGVVVGETAVVGADVLMYHGVTLGGTSLDRVRRHPHVGDGVMIGAGAKVLGPIDVGSGTRVGANAVLVKSVAPGSVVVGVPGQVVAPRGSSAHSPDAHLTAEAAVGGAVGVSATSGESAETPDPLANAVRSLMRRVSLLESSGAPGPVAGSADTYPIARADGVWECEDYSI